MKDKKYFVLTTKKRMVYLPFSTKDLQDDENILLTNYPNGLLFTVEKDDVITWVVPEYFSNQKIAPNVATVVYCTYDAYMDIQKNVLANTLRTIEFLEESMKTFKKETEE
jgi:hypothetical protein